MGTPGQAGWFTSPVSVEVDALDENDEQPLVQVQDGSDWTPYVGPVQVAADGQRTVTYRAVDASGNVSAPASIDVKVDRRHRSRCSR